MNRAPTGLRLHPPILFPVSLFVRQPADEDGQAAPEADKPGCLVQKNTATRAYATGACLSPAPRLRSQYRQILLPLVFGDVSAILLPL
jgi:hypothetical protein